jgi:hypothetical protein
MCMDIVESEYMKLHYPDRQENEPDEFSTCAACNKTLYVGDAILLHYGFVCCRTLDCLISTTDTQQIIAGEDEEID